MKAIKLPEQPYNLADEAAESADRAIKATQSAANAALNGLAGTVEEARQPASPSLVRAAERADAMAQRSLDAVRSGTRRLRSRAERTSQTTVKYIKDEPVRSVLIAAATGAALLALVNLLTRSRERS